MGKITLVGEAPKTDDLHILKEWISNLSKDVQQQVNGNLIFGDNIKCSILDISFTAADVDQATRHTLGKIPSGYWLVDSNVATSLYRTTAATVELITLKSTAVANTKVLVF